MDDKYDIYIVRYILHVDGSGLNRDIPAEHIKVRRSLNQLLGTNSTYQKHSNPCL